MSRRIRGITVEIGGDTTGLDKALKSVNTSIRNTQAGLRDVNRLLKLDPTNSNLLAQKQKLLQKEINETSEKLKTLKEADKQAKAQLERGELGQDKYDALQREIIETEEKLKSLQLQSETTNSTLAKMGEVGSKIESAGDKISDVGKKVMPASLAVTGLGFSAVKMSSDFDTSMSKVSAISGTTGEAFEKLRDKAREMGAKTKFSATDAADAMTYMAMAGWKTEDMLHGIDGIMNLAAASGEDLALTSDIVTDALTGFGLTAKDSAHFADVLAAASSNSNTNVALMGETFKYVAPIAGALGFTAEDTAEAIGLMANSGIKGSQAGTSLRNIMTNLSKDFEISGKAIGEVTIQTTNADGSMRSLSEILGDCREAFSKLTEAEKAHVAEQLVGKQAMSGFLALMNAAPADVDKLSQAIKNADGTAESMAKTMQDNLGGQLEELSSAAEELAISFGDMMVPVIRKVVEGIQAFIDKLNGMSEEQKQVVLTIGLIVAALGPFLVILGTVISKVGIAMQAFVKLAGGFSKFKLVLTGSSGVVGKLATALTGITAPITAVIGVVAGLVAAFVTLWNTNEEFRNSMIEIWTSIQNTISSFVQGIKERLEALNIDFTGLVETLKALWMGLCDLLAPLFEGAFLLIATILETTLGALTGILDVFIGLFTGNWEQAWTGVKEIFSSLWEGIKGVFETVINTIQNLADTILSWFGTSWNEAWTGISEFFIGIWTGISEFLSNTWETIKNVVQVGVMAIGEILNAAITIITLPFQFVWENCKDILIPIWDFMKTHISNAINGIKSVIETVLNTIHTIFSTIWNQIKTVVSSVLEAIKSVVSSVWSQISSTIKGVMDGIKNTLSGIWNSIKSTVSSTLNGIKSTVSSVFNSIKSTATNVWNGIKSAITGPIDSAKNFVKGAIDKMKGFFNFKWSLPKIKLPHFSIKGKFSLAPPSIPKFSVDWYKKAMNKPMLLNGATIFGQKGNTLLGGGEKGPEVIMGLSTLESMTQNNNQASLELMGQIFNVMLEYFPQFANNSIYIDSKELASKMASSMDIELNKLSMRKQKGW
ncbi:phage tail tape measure protein [Allofustis seminis]|uniref:phage tail tape measure protein n=1 Tax=Allofustis seminis TaxID=166939 RepID=UPI00037FD516|nr:phage tail tape measure protein [Allofustis seminis]